MLLGYIALCIHFIVLGFNGHPPLGVNATGIDVDLYHKGTGKFQWAPTRGGECYIARILRNKYGIDPFQWAPTLGGECYNHLPYIYSCHYCGVSMGTHPWG